MTLLELLGLMRRNIKLVVILPVLCAIVMAVIGWGFLQNEYTATVNIYALSKLDATQVDNSSALTSTDLTGSQLLANDIAELAQNSQVQDEAAKKSGLQNATSYKIAVESSTTSRVLSVSVTGKSAATAALLANNLAKVIDNTARDVMDVKSVNVISAAQTPDEPSGPKRVMYVAVAFLAGLFLAIAIIVLMDMLNTKIRREEEVVEITGVPVIGRFPKVVGGASGK